MADIRTLHPVSGADDGGDEPAPPTDGQRIAARLRGLVAGDAWSGPGELRGLGRGTAPAKRNIGVLAFALVAVAIAVAGLRIWGQIEKATGSAGFTWGLVFAFIPVLPLIALYLWLDRYEPEPARLLALGFCWGAFIATAIALLLNQLGSALIGTQGDGGFRAAVFIAPPVEELAKGSFVLILAFSRRRRFDGIIDALVYAGMVGIGFAFTENILYYGNIFAELAKEGGAHAGLSAVWRLFVVRGLVSPFAHPLFTSFTAIGVGIAVRQRSTLVRFLAPITGYVFAMTAHALWNGAVSLASGAFLYVYLFLMVPIFAGMLAFALVMRSREVHLVTARLSDYVRFGWLAPYEVGLLATFRGRRALRREAKRSGRAAEKAARGFLRSATELAYLRDKMVRGVAGVEAVAAEKELLDDLRSRRPSVVMPVPVGGLLTGR